MNNEFNVFEYILQSHSKQDDNNQKEKLHTLRKKNETDCQNQFYNVCKKVDAMINDVEKEEGLGNETKILERQRKAILGQIKEVEYYKNLIKNIVRENDMENEYYPSWYENLSDALFSEILGFAGLTEWIESRTKELGESSSAKTIGDRIYFMVGGEMKLQPQRLTEDRRRQLRIALLLRTPEKRIHDTYHEVYLEDGTRVIIYNEGLTKKGQDCLVFRKFFVKEHTFEEQEERGTIPKGAVPLFKEMVKVGYNVAFIGAVKTAKTTFLTTWQSYEKENLEGVMVETDPEIPLHLIMPNAPIMQFVPTDEDFQFVVKKVLRADADYIIMAEARDGIALQTAVKAANKGTRRVKITFHTTDAIDFCYDVADEITGIFKSDLGTTITKVAKSFNYLFQFLQLEDKSKKRLKAIWEVRYDLQKRQVSMHLICKYDIENDNWSWAYDIGQDKKELGMEEQQEAFNNFENILKSLACKQPLHSNGEGEYGNTFYPSYNSFINGGRNI